jgi:oligoendopeptidase F
MFTRQFVPDTFNPAVAGEVVAQYQLVLERPIGSAGELERWLSDCSELSSVMDEFGSRRYIDKSCHTEDAAIEARYMQFVEDIEPNIKPLFFAIQKKYLACPFRSELKGKRYETLHRRWGADVALFRQENVPLETEATRVNTEYDKICGAMMVDFEGGSYTIQQMARFQEKLDRDVRQRAWQAAANRRLRDADSIEPLFERLLGLRQRIASNAGLDNFRSVIWLAYKRFDYTPEQCLGFAAAIEQSVVPLVKELDRRRKRDLGVEKLRPWDVSVDPHGRPPLEPFNENEIANFVEKTKMIFDRISPALGEDFDLLRRRKNLDLASRAGKQPGGYQCNLEEAREPFIFMNAAGLQGDVQTLLHEGGHAFHLLAAREEPLMYLRSAPIEFCEVASMSMELLGAEHFDVFYSAADARRAKRMLLEGVIRLLSWIATIDSFQHWLYTHPGHSQEERTGYWRSLLDRFGGEVDWSGYEGIRDRSWQKQMHLFNSPFYYVEYGIAQLGALQVWMKSRVDPRQALANYRAALALGGTRSLPELFAAAGIQFDFSSKTLLPLMDAVREELGSHVA